MLAARLASRNVPHLARTFATVVDAAGIKVASVDSGQPTASVTLLVKAGTRYETWPGVAHALKNFAFKSTSSRSALRTVRESELYGGVLSSRLSREHLAITAEFLRGDEEYFVDLLTSFTTSAKFTAHELDEYVFPATDAEAAAARTDAATHALEAAHALAFRTGLGRPLAPAAHARPPLADVVAYAHAAFARGNVAVLGTGVDAGALARLVERAHAHAAQAQTREPYASASAPDPATTTTAAAANPPASAPSVYYGGETRVEMHGSGPQAVFVGFGVAGAPPAALAVLAAHLAPESSVKWGRGLSPVVEGGGKGDPGAADGGGLPVGTEVRAVLLPYSDAALFGLLVRGAEAGGVRRAAKSAVKALKECVGAMNASGLDKAVAKAKFAAASAVEGREGFVSVLGPKVLEGSGPANIESTLSALDGVTLAGFNKIVTTLIKGKPTYVAVGDIHTLPYADELGL